MTDDARQRALDENARRSRVMAEAQHFGPPVAQAAAMARLRCSAMARFKITYTSSTGKEDRTVDADGYIRDGDWFVFLADDVEAAGASGGVLRVKAGEVSEIERLGDALPEARGGEASHL